MPPRSMLAVVCVVRAAAALTPSGGTRTPQVLRMRDAATRQEIRLVGTVHYNPASIARAKEEVTSTLAAHDGRMGAVVVESCESRWTKSLELDTELPLLKRLVRSEMQGAAGVALQNEVPVMLGDSDVGPFLERVKKLAKCRHVARRCRQPRQGRKMHVEAHLMFR